MLHDAVETARSLRNKAPPPVHCSKPGVTNATSEYPQTTRLLTAYMKQCQPTFLFTSIQINVGHAAKPHVDSNNLGSSLGIGVRLLATV